MLKQKTIIILILCFTLSGLNSCKTKEVEVPSYLYLKPAIFTTKSDLSQGRPAAVISDYWVFKNEAVRGDFAPKLTIPLQQTGKAVIRISPGVKYSGDQEERIIYPMFTTYSKEINFTANKVDSIEPTFTYVDNTVFPLIEDFEGNGFAFAYNPALKLNGDTIIWNSGNEALIPGKNSGEILLGSGQDNTVLEIYSQVFKTWPRLTPFFLEFDYKCDVPFSFGFYTTDPDGTTSQYSIYVLNAKADWNKMYYDLESEISAKVQGTSFRLFFQFRNDLGATATAPKVWLDNIKIVYLD